MIKGKYLRFRKHPLYACCIVSIVIHVGSKGAQTFDPTFLASTNFFSLSYLSLFFLFILSLVAWSPWFIFLLYTYDYLYFILFSFQISVVI